MYADKLKQIEQSILDDVKGDKDAAKGKFEDIRNVVFQMYDASTAISKSLFRLREEASLYDPEDRIYFIEGEYDKQASLYDRIYENMNEMNGFCRAHGVEKMFKLRDKTEQPGYLQSETKNFMSEMDKEGQEYIKKYMLEKTKSHRERVGFGLDNIEDNLDTGLDGPSNY